MLKIVHLTEAWKGGIATYVEGLIKYQGEIERQEVHLICSQSETPKLGNINSSQYFYKSSRKNPVKILLAIKSIKKIIKEINPDVIHAHSTFAGLYSRLFKLKRTDGTIIPVIYCAHGWCFTQEKPWLIKAAYKFIERRMLPNTAAIINLSRYEAEIASKAGIKTGINRIILSCVRDSRQTDNNPIVIQKDKINIGFIGRLDKQKGYDFFTEQMQLCKRDDIQIHIIGGSVLGDDKTQINKNYNYIGWVDNTKIDDYIKQLDVIVAPSRWEGFSLLVLEVMRGSRPLIVSNRTSLPEVVIHGFNGYIFDFANPDSFLDIIENLDKDTLSIMGRNAREIFEKCFMGDKHCIQTDKLYMDVMKACNVAQENFHLQAV